MATTVPTTHFVRPLKVSLAVRPFFESFVVSCLPIICVAMPVHPDDETHHEHSNTIGIALNASVLESMAWQSISRATPTNFQE